MKIVILATEASGDFLGSELIKTLMKNNKFEIQGVGGQLMIDQGLESWVSINEFNAIGIFEVLIRIFKFINLFKIIVKRVKKYNPDILITIDSPSFSYRIVQKLQNSKQDIKFFHYVAPTVWAWKSYRAKIFAKIYDKMFTLFYFEPKYFLKHGLKSKFVGHQIFFNKSRVLRRGKIISFFPGSRTVEIKNNMKKLKQIILICSKNLKEYQIYVLILKQHEVLVKDIINDRNVKIISNIKDKHILMRKTHLAVAASGSVTLELIKYCTPTLVFYETHWFTKNIIRMMVKVKYASIINIIHKKMIIPEFLFEEFNANNMITEINKWLNDNELRAKQLKYFKAFSKRMLNNGINPSELIVKNLRN